MIDPPALAWLQMLHGRAEYRWIEVRWAPKGKKMRREYVRPTEFSMRQLAENCVRWGNHGDVFVGVAPRVEDRRDHRGGGLDNVSEAWVLWVDCDTPESVELLAAFRPEPTMVVRSGTGENCHAYWALTKAIPAAWVREGNSRLACALRADPKCAEPARILRPPGTKNWKDDQPAAVTTAWLLEPNDEPMRYPFSFVADLPDAVKPEPKRTTTAPKRVETTDPLLGLSALEYVPRLTGREVDGRGYVQCPFHSGGSERTPSLMPYEDPARGFHCFGCGASGDIYRFASRLWNVSDKGADFPKLRERLTEALL